MSTARIVLTLAPAIGIVFAGFFVIGLAMPVLPLYVHHGLGMGMLVVGLVAGAQFVASLISRFPAGRQADSAGAKRAIIIGLVLSLAAGMLYALSLPLAHLPGVSATVLFFGRGVLGAGESFIVAGALVWGLALVGAENAGMVMAWVGTPMYIAYALGAPAGTVLYGRFGFAAIAVATIVVPLGSLLLAARLRAVAARPQAGADLWRVLRAVWLPGLGLALGSIGFGAITTFVALLFAAHGWGSSWLAFTVLSGAFVVGRLAFGHLPDKIGGAQVAIACIVVEALGQALIWGANGAVMAIAGVAFSGFGYALVYPAFGVDAIRRAPADSRGVATGAYTACLDLALGIGNPRWASSPAPGASRPCSASVPCSWQALPSSRC